LKLANNIFWCNDSAIDAKTNKYQKKIVSLLFLIRFIL
jgi:hypothetical protein